MAIETSFELVARSWHEQREAARSARHADYVLRRLEADVFPVLGTVPVAEITAARLVAMAKKIEQRGALDIAKRALQTCGQIMRYAVAHGLAERNPAADVKPGDVLKSRREIIALTFVRTSELIKATWDEFNLEAAEWRIPAERMKMRTPHVVPLSVQAVDAVRCLAELRNLSPYLFPGERDHEQPMPNNTILMALGRMGYKGRMTGHGFRGIASTVLHELGWRHDVIELQLAHQERNQVSAAYNWATYLPERRKMMQACADHLDALRKGADVVPLRAA